MADTEPSVPPLPPPPAYYPGLYPVALQVNIPRYVQLKQGFLLGVMMLNIAGMIGVMFMYDQFVALFINTEQLAAANPDVSPENIKQVCRTVFLVMCAISIVFEVVFAYGVYRRHYCLSAFYTVVLVMATALYILKAVHTSSVFVIICAMYNLVIMFVAISFVRDVRALRRYYKQPQLKSWI